MKKPSILIIPFLLCLILPVYANPVEVAAKADKAIDNKTCLECHATEEPIVSEHALSGSAHESLNCTDCHSDLTETPHDVPAKVNCSSCHDDVGAKFAKSIHYKAIHDKGLNVAPSCVNCHGTHNILPASNPVSSVYKLNVPQTCRKCHEGIFNDYATSIHGKLWRSGQSNVPVCTSCHSEHDIVDPTSQSAQKNIPLGCSQCHQSRSASYQDTFHGKATALGLTETAKCSGCHTAHKILPESDPLSSVNKANLKETCTKCHAGVNQNFIDYDPHMDPHNKERSALVFYTYNFMNWLLILVFAFWGLHTGLWFQRSVVALIRREFTIEAHPPQYIRRFSNFQRRMHGIVVVSFTGLVLTGLPLKYYYTTWAQNLSQLLGGIETSRHIHHIFGVVTIGYLVVHMVQMFYLIVIKKEKRFLGGPESMVPRAKDWEDFIDNIKWFFYKGDRPKYDRWTYFEKFDYLAVFWGVCVIGLSGVIMWQPAFFAQFLPGEILNAATIVHSDEALLALAFIFTIHFFHNHLRVENFPIDLTIFSGVVPLERFIKERPLEYQRLVQEGKLEKYLVPPPSKKTIIKCFIFGFTALGIGFFMIMAIFITFLTGGMH